MAALTVDWPDGRRLTFDSSDRWGGMMKRAGTQATIVAFALAWCSVAPAAQEQEAAAPQEQAATAQQEPAPQEQVIRTPDLAGRARRA